jgi:adenylyltransferase/sulfurtransferase
MGVFAPLTGIVGSIQAAETLKILTGAGDNLSGRLLLIDSFGAEWRSVRLTRDPACPVCQTREVKHPQSVVHSA